MIALLLLLTLPTIQALLSFDCGGPFVNITTISLINTGECELSTETITEEAVKIQLLQKADYDFTDIMQCRISVSRYIQYCGMHSHTSAVHNGIAEYLRDIPYEQCRRMQQDGSLTFGGNLVIDGLKVNSTTVRSITLAGTLSGDGVCQGATYSDPYGTWSNVVVQAKISISLRSGRVPVQINSGKISLRSGTVCELTASYCIDPEDGYTFWKGLPEKTCNYNQYDVLYEGRAIKTKSSKAVNAPTIYSLTTDKTTFALMKTSETRFCGYTIYNTEHPKLFIVENEIITEFERRKTTAVENLDIFTYVNSKFVYVEKHLRTQMTTLYRDIILQKCELEKQVLTQALALARFQPDEFAYTVMRQPGYMAVTAGEAAHIIKCIPVESQLRPTEECFNELPVVFRNQSFFITPKSRILQRVGTKRECNRLIPVMYKGHDNWIRFLPKPIDAPEPAILKPNTKLTWTYLTPEKLATSGIYSQDQIDQLREHIMFPAERPALVNNIVQGLSGKQSLDGGLSMYNLLDEDTLNKIADSTSKRIWSGFITFGSMSAGVIGIFIVIRLIKLLIDTLIHGYAIHSVYGCGLHLLGAIWSSVTHLLLHLARPRTMDGATTTTTSAETQTTSTNAIEISSPIPIPKPTANEFQRAHFTLETETAPQSEIPIDTPIYRALRQQLYSPPT